MLTLTPTPSKISDYIYLASSSACKDEKLLNELEIKDILVIGNSVQIAPSSLCLSDEIDNLIRWNRERSIH